MTPEERWEQWQTFDPPLADPIQFAIERNDCECDVCQRARANAEARLDEMKREIADLKRRLGYPVFAR